MNRELDVWEEREKLDRRDITMPWTAMRLYLYIMVVFTGVAFLLPAFVEVENALIAVQKTGEQRTVKRSKWFPAIRFKSGRFSLSKRAG